jgi:2-dehydro-3-deoxyphosphogluconate aldolase/(4S)-4-hydroxy-2-oxoglutarate aldolase
MTREEVKQIIAHIGIFPAIRVGDPADALYAAETLYAAGIPVAEITMTTPGAVDVIAELTKRFPDFAVGAGTVLDTATAERCVDAGARFLTSTGLVFDVVEQGVKSQVVVVPGALTPSEVIAAWRAGADFVKIFPAAAVGGDLYIRSLQLPLPHIPLIAAGGVNQQTAMGFILAGACALGVGMELLPREAVLHRQSQRIHGLARRFLGFVREARAS